MEIGAPEDRIKSLKADALTPWDEYLLLSGTWARDGLVRDIEYTAQSLAVECVGPTTKHKPDFETFVAASPNFYINPCNRVR